MKEIRESAVAGIVVSWTNLMCFPGMSKDTSKMPKGRRSRERSLPLSHPHAGYAYSGQVAAYAYKLIEGKSFDTVVVVAPSHYVHFKGCSRSVIGEDTGPLWDVVPVDMELSRKDDGEKEGDSIYS